MKKGNILLKNNKGISIGEVEIILPDAMLLSNLHSIKKVDKSLKNKTLDSLIEDMPARKYISQCLSMAYVLNWFSTYKEALDIDYEGKQVKIPTNNIFAAQSIDKIPNPAYLIHPEKVSKIKSYEIDEFFIRGNTSVYQTEDKSRYYMIQNPRHNLQHFLPGVPIAVKRLD